MPSQEKNENQDDLVHAIAYADSLEERQSALRSLITSKAIHKEFASDKFQESLKQIAETAKKSEDPVERLTSISQICRISAVVKKAKKITEPYLQDALEKPLPSIMRQIKSDDRVYIAQAMKFAPKSWAIEFLISSILEEETAEKCREECVERLLDFTADISHIMELFTEQVKSANPFKDMNPETISIRLRRILSCVSNVILGKDIEVKEELGANLESLIKASFQQSGDNIKREQAKDLAVVVIQITHEIIRSNFSLATQHKTYKAVRYTKSWFNKDDWPKIVESKIKLLEEDLTQALSVLAKQGIADGKLLEELVEISGSKQRARVRTTAIADSITGIPPKLDKWLRKLGAVSDDKSTEAMEQSALLSADENIAFLLLDSEKLRVSIELASEMLLSSIRVFEPTQTENLERILKRASTVIDGVASVARKRKLQLRGSPGDVVEFSSNEHELVNNQDYGTRYVCLINPGVERRVSDSEFGIVVKALAEPKEE